MDAVPKTGDMAPAFELPDSTGQAQTLGGLLKEKNLLLIFFRGVW